MICKVKETIKKLNINLNGTTVCVALSGGADSMALLNVMNELKEEYGFILTACHVNHGIRGESADSDEAFAVSECEKLGIKIHVLHADVPSVAAEKGIGLEECGRRIRYEFFSSLGNVIIATAHTLSDRCETLILNETRGSSLKGLCSIPVIRGNIIRPLILCTRADIEKYCADKNISYVTDETNSDDTYSRNRIRLNVIPQLKMINPGFEQAVGRLIESVSEDEDYLEIAASEAFDKSKNSDGSFCSDDILKLHTALRRRVIALILKTEADITPELTHIKMVENILGGGRTQIIGKTVVEVKYSRLIVNPSNDLISDWEYDFTSLFAVTPVGEYTAKIINKNELSTQQFVHNNVLDFDNIIGNCIIRNRRPGDKMRCAGSDCTKTLKKLFNEKHLINRNSVPVLADEIGVLWVKGIGCADRCKITNDTKKILLMGENKND